MPTVIADEITLAIGSRTQVPHLRFYSPFARYKTEAVIKIEYRLHYMGMVLLSTGESNFRISVRTSHGAKSGGYGGRGGITRFLEKENQVFWWTCAARPCHGVKEGRELYDCYLLPAAGCKQVDEPNLFPSQAVIEPRFISSKYIAHMFSTPAHFSNIHPRRSTRRYYRSSVSQSGTQLQRGRKSIKRISQVQSVYVRDGELTEPHRLRILIALGCHFVHACLCTTDKKSTANQVQQAVGLICKPSSIDMNQFRNDYCLFKAHYGHAFGSRLQVGMSGSNIKESQVFFYNEPRSKRECEPTKSRWSPLHMDTYISGGESRMRCRPLGQDWDTRWREEWYDGWGRENRPSELSFTGRDTTAEVVTSSLHSVTV
ncbi:hypothetical protein EVAR_14132_1 [Eumeta japonica]|uniref:Uncharacterized protein n=1 Tax=Eumeta variegata TaxID=151549 RepID=A0A4C1UEN6_EUMVA|nr:hypothetical protein EVAR_14132_1 [Eumeta japonica]